MNVNILLVSPYKNSFLGLAKFPPLGLGYLSTALRKRGYQVNILDCLNRGIDKFSYRNYLIKEQPNIVGVNSWSCSINEVNEILDITKKINKDIVTIVGGPHPSALPNRIMDDFKNADFGFNGEAEIGFPALVDKLTFRKKFGFKDIPGLIWKGEEININNKILHKNIDDFDYLSWDLIRPQDYSRAGVFTAKKTAPIFTSRGCPYQCTFCSAHIISGRKIRLRSINNIYEEIKFLKERYGIKKIAIMDENFTFYKEHAMGFCNKVISEKIKMRYFLPQGVRLDTLDKELLLLMKQAGFTPNIALGIESGSERILKMIKKGINKDIVREKVALLRKFGFRPVGYFVIGFPTETKKEIYETLRFAKELKLYRAAFSPLLLLPATEIYEDLKNSGEIPKDFDFANILTDKISYSPKGIPIDEFNKIHKDIVWKFNIQPRVIWDYLRDGNSLMFAIFKFLNILFVNKNKGV